MKLGLTPLMFAMLHASLSIASAQEPPSLRAAPDAGAAAQESRDIGGAGLAPATRRAEPRQVRRHADQYRHRQIRRPVQVHCDRRCSIHARRGERRRCARHGERRGGHCRRRQGHRGRRGFVRRDWCCDGRRGRFVLSGDRQHRRQHRRRCGRHGGRRLHRRVRLRQIRQGLRRQGRHRHRRRCSIRRR